jgi:hypothetical protein
MALRKPSDVTHLPLRVSRPPHETFELGGEQSVRGRDENGDTLEQRIALAEDLAESVCHGFGAALEPSMVDAEDGADVLWQTPAQETDPRDVGVYLLARPQAEGASLDQPPDAYFNRTVRGTWGEPSERRRLAEASKGHVFGGNGSERVRL